MARKKSRKTEPEARLHAIVETSASSEIPVTEFISNIIRTGLLGTRERLPADLRAAKQEMTARFLNVLGRVSARSVEAAAPRVSSRMVAAATPDPRSNVVGVGIGEKIEAGKLTGISAVKFFVKVKYPENQLEPRFLLPKTLDGLPVDVEETGVLRAQGKKKSARVATRVMPDPRVRRRPARPGCSIGFIDAHSVMAGTFGALVTKRGKRYLLSNNHVIGNEDELPGGAGILQPGTLDGGNPARDVIARLTQTVKLKAEANNRVDAAIAEVLDTTDVINEILFLGAPQGAVSAEIDMIVHKFGRTTGYRVGRVTSVDTDVVVAYDSGDLVFEEQIVIKGPDGQAFSDSGDSGSLILERSTRNAIGLLFAGSHSHTIANHLSDVLKALKVKLV